MASQHSPFHLSLPTPRLEHQRDFYVRLLGCPRLGGNDGYEDFDFFGNQLTFHEETTGQDLSYRTLHFGAVLSPARFEEIRTALSRDEIAFLVEPREEARGTPEARWRMVFADPSGYAIELKSDAELTRVLVGGPSAPSPR